MTSRSDEDQSVEMQELYASIGKAMLNADCIETLSEAWKLRLSDLKRLPADWRALLIADKDRLKAEFLEGKR